MKSSNTSKGFNKGRTGRARFLLRPARTRKSALPKRLRKLNGSMSMWMSVSRWTLLYCRRLSASNISTAQMMALANVYQELGLPTLSELILGLPGDSYERHVKSLSEVVEAGIRHHRYLYMHVAERHRAQYRLSRGDSQDCSHFRILPRGLREASKGRIAVEIERSLVPRAQCHFEDYQEARKLHLMIRIYNGGGLSPLLRLFPAKRGFLYRVTPKIVEDIKRAPLLRCRRSSSHLSG